MLQHITGPERQAKRGGLNMNSKCNKILSLNRNQARDIKALDGHRNQQQVKHNKTFSHSFLNFNILTSGGYILG